MSSGGKPPTKPSKTQHIQKQVDSVVGVMQQNVQSVMERGEKLDNMKNKSEELERGSQSFKAGTTRVKKAMWMQNMKLNIIIGIVVLLIVGAVVGPLVLKKK